MGVPIKDHELLRQAEEKCAELLNIEPLSELVLNDQEKFELYTVLIGSQYVSDRIIENPQLFYDLFTSKDFYRDMSQNDFNLKLKTLIENEVANKDELKRQLRLCRQREMIRIVWRDLNRLSDLQQTTRELSWLAQSCVDFALNWLFEQAIVVDGMPYSGTESDKGVIQRLLVLGLGKLGAYELNLSSDIDLMFVYPEQGYTWKKNSEGILQSKISNQAFFIRLSQELISALDQVTVDGFVFRVDMRLRPYGDSGQLAMSIPAMVQYYQDQGRDWERYALIKARVIAGDNQQGEKLLKSLRPFIYRRYLDFSVIEALRKMKRLIDQEGKRLKNNIKLGLGGIREIEFIAQAFQLIRGGQDLELQQPGLLPVLDILENLDYLPSNVVFDLKDSYIFLRNLEHAIQAQLDQQTHQIPKDESWQKRLAFNMGFSDWFTLSQKIEKVRLIVHDHFVEFFADDEQADNLDQSWQLIWEQKLDQDKTNRWLEKHGFDAKSVVEQLQLIRQHPNISFMQSLGRQRLDQFIPLLLDRISHLENIQNRNQTLDRVLRIVQQVLRRTAYLVLLIENPRALEQMIALCAQSAWVAEQLSLNPVLLDELLDKEKLYRLPDRLAVQTELSSYMNKVPKNDLESQMDRLRYFKKANVLKVAAAELEGSLPLMKVSDYLTYIAETIIVYVVDLAWCHMVQKYGSPSLPTRLSSKGFMVIAYGKLGGLELSYNSDLDLVFIHDGVSNGVTSGPKVIDNMVFFTRLAQRVVHILSTYTASGQLYDIDLRLRPEGDSGVLVARLDTFDLYQKEQAWNWEHQALVRARVVYGEAYLKATFSDMRLQILTNQRDKLILGQRVIEMRAKMRASQRILSKSKSSLTHRPWLRKKLKVKTQPRKSFINTSREEISIKDLKNRNGGIIDIEFIVQYLLLLNAYHFPVLARYTDNISILEHINKAGLLSSDDVSALEEAYKFFRSLAHRLVITESQNFKEEDYQKLTEYSAKVTTVWDNLFTKSDN